MTYWKIIINGETEAWLQFNDNMESQGIFDKNGNEIVGCFDYTPVEFNTNPPF